MEMRSKMRSVDVQGVSCPVNAVRVKHAISELSDGELIEILVDEGDAIIMVARSINDAGHRIFKVERREHSVSIIAGKR